MTKAKEVTVPTYDQLINPTFQALKALGGSGSNDEIYNKVIELENFTDNVLSVMRNEHSNQSLIAYRLGWAKTYLKKCGVINNTSRGIWVINNEYETINKFNVKELVRMVRIITNANTEMNNNNLTDVEIEVPDEAEDWRLELKELLYEMNPFDFEKLTQLLLRECGFSQIEVTKKTGDGGIDGFGKLKINGIISFKLAFQCKRYQGMVTPKEIRDFRGSMTADIEKAILITTGSFTRKAIEEANADGKMHIDLIDGEQLIDKLIELKLGVKEEIVYKVDRNFFTNFNINN